MALFQRMFGRSRRSPVEGEGSADAGTEATEERADEINSDGFLLLGDTTSQSSSVSDPPPGYTISGATAFLPYDLAPRAPGHPNIQRAMSVEPKSAIDGVPFKLGSNVLVEGSIQDIDVSSASNMIEKINSFNWDDYEYSFQLERSILQEFNAPEQEPTSE